MSCSCTLISFICNTLNIFEVLIHCILLLWNRFVIFQTEKNMFHFFSTSYPIFTLYPREYLRPFRSMWNSITLSWWDISWKYRILVLREPAAHYSDVIMSAMASQITSLMIVYSSFYSGADKRKRQSSASLGFVRGIHRRPVKSPHKGPVTRKMFPFDDVIMRCKITQYFQMVRDYWMVF